MHHGITSHAYNAYKHAMELSDSNDAVVECSTMGLQVLFHATLLEQQALGQCMQLWRHVHPKL